MVSEFGFQKATHEVDLSVLPPTVTPALLNDRADEAMVRYSNGDQGAFSLVYDAVCPEIMGWLQRRVRNPAVVEELVQQTFVKMHRHRGRFLAGARVRPWAMAIAMRLCIDHFRRRAHEQRIFGDDSTGADRPDGAASAEEMIDAQRMARELEREIGELPGIHRDAFLLVRREGRSLEEAARILGTTATAIKLRVFRATARLRQKIRSDDRRDDSGIQGDGP